MTKDLNLDSTELRCNVKKLKLTHSIISQKTLLSNAIKPAYMRDRIKFKPIHAQVQSYACISVHMQYHSFPQLLISGINSQLQC